MLIGGLQSLIPHVQSHLYFGFNSVIAAGIPMSCHLINLQCFIQPIVKDSVSDADITILRSHDMLAY